MADYKYKTITVHEDDYRFYEEIREKFAENNGAKLSLAQVLSIGMKFYYDRRFVKKQSEDEDL